MKKILTNPTPSLHSTTQQLNNSTTQQLNNSTTQQLNNSTTQQLNNSTTQQLNNSSRFFHKIWLTCYPRDAVP